MFPAMLCSALLSLSKHLLRVNYQRVSPDGLDTVTRLCFSQSGFFSCVRAASGCCLTSVLTTFHILLRDEGVEPGERGKE